MIEKLHEVSPEGYQNSSKATQHSLCGS